jgi:tRNA (cytidine/uridine-2'-O-)-methyltransferase
MQRRFTVVLVSPRDPGNVGSVGRTVVGLGGRLAIVGPHAFDMEDQSKATQRSRLDYWDKLEWGTYRSWGEFVRLNGGLEAVREKGFFFSAHAKALMLDQTALTSEKEAKEETLLVFGSETSGFKGLISEEQLASFRLVKIPMQNPDMRCYNLAVSVGMVLWESFRQNQRERRD